VTNAQRGHISPAQAHPPVLHAPQAPMPQDWGIYQPQFANCVAQAPMQTQQDPLHAIYVPMLHILLVQASQFAYRVVLETTAQ
jgi:hypothetical protein